MNAGRLIVAALVLCCPTAQGLQASEITGDLASLQGSLSESFVHAADGKFETVPEKAGYSNLTASTDRSMRDGSGQGAERVFAAAPAPCSPSTRDSDMTSELATTRVAYLVLAVAATFSGCGGGGDSASAALGGNVANTADTATASSSASQAADTSIDSTDAASTDAAQVAASKLAALVPSEEAALTATSSSTSTAVIASTISTSTASDNVAAIASASSAGSLAAVTSSATASGGSISISTPTPAKTTHSGVGINLSSITSYSAEIPTIDMMKKASPWLTQCKAGGTCANFATGAVPFDTKEEASLDLDADGWVRSIPDASAMTTKYRWATTKVAEAGIQQAGNYTVVYDGAGTLTYSGAGKKVDSLSKPGRDVVAVENSDTQPFYLNITASVPSNYLRNIRVYPPGGACSANLSVYVLSASACTGSAEQFVAFENFPSAQSTWHPAFLSGLKGFRTIRFMDWGMTNATQVTAWADRTQASARTWNATTGVPVERMFDLAAAVGADSWMNIPPYANDAYIKSFAQLAHAHLAANSKLYLEYGNEMWNYSFNATKWSAAQSKTLYAAELAGGAIPGVLQMNWYAQRLVQACKIVKAEFGADASRVKCVANTQAANPWATGQTLACAYAKASLNGVPCGKQIDAVAIAPYFGLYIGSSKTLPTVTTWAADADGGLGKIFQEIGGTSSTAQTPALLTAFGTGAATGALAQSISWMTGSKAAADVYGLPMLAYEGGQGLVSPTGDATVLNLMYAANRDARMGAVYQAMMTAWKNSGGQTFMYFSDVGRYAKSGMWGLRESQFDETPPKWQAAVKWRDTVPCWWAGC